MKRLLIAAVLMLLWAASSFGQTTVNLTVSDLPDGQTWNNGTWQVHLILPGFPGDARFTIISGGGSLADQSGSLSGTGTASFSLPANANIAPAGSIWRFTVCPDASAGCSIAAVTITTSSPQAVTINPNSIRINVAVSTPPFWAYADGEIQNAVKGSSYFNTALLQDRICTTNPVSGGTCTVWTGPNGGTAAAAGTAGQTQINDNASPGTIGATGCLSFPDKTVGPTTSNCNARFKGPNPYVDLTAYGVRAACSNVTVAPCGSGITATTTSGQSTVPISSASTFQNGDGVVIQNAGATNGLGAAPTPTVTPFNMRAGTGTGDGVAAPAGATTFNYTVFACDLGGGCTAAGPAGSTVTGNALGAQSVTVTSATRSNDTLTYNTSSQIGASVGAVVILSGFSTADNAAGFGGTWCQISTVAAGNFTCNNTPLDTRNGAATASAGGGVATFFNYNKVTWTAVTGNPFRYFVCSDRQSPGTFVLLGPARLPVNPTNSGFTEGTLEFDDFGQTMMSKSALVVPWYVSNANCTGAATNDNWVTTILSGAGTTTLTMSGNAPNSNGGPLTIRFDNAPNHIAAAAANPNKPLVLPFDASGNQYVYNSVLNLAVDAYGPLLTPQGAVFNDTVLIGRTTSWYGNRLPGNGTSTQFQSQSVPKVTTSGTPGVFCTNGFSCYTEGLQFFGPDNGVTFLQDGGGGALGSTYVNNGFFSGATANDYMGMAFVCRGAGGGSCIGSFDGKTVLFSGTQAMGSTSATPSFFCDGCGQFRIKDLMGSSRALAFFGGDNSGTGAGVLTIERADWQGGSTPFVLSYARVGTSAGVTVNLGSQGNIILDTMAQPCVANLAAQPSITIGGCNPSSSVPQITGTRTFSNAGIVAQNISNSVLQYGLAYDGTLFPGAAGSYAVQNDNLSRLAGSPYFIGIAGITPSLNTCPISAGGSVSVASHPFTITPVWWNGGQGATSNICTAVTSSGNQTVTLNWTLIPGNPNFIRIYDNGSRISVTAPGTATSIVISSETFTGNLNVGIAAGGPTMLMPGTQGIATPQLTLAGVNTQKVMLQSVYTNATTTPSNITGLSFSASANTNYHMSCDVYFQGSVNTAGLDITITGPAAPTNVFYSLDEDSTNATNINSVASAFGTKLVAQNVTATTNLHAYISLGLQNGATAGTVQVQGSATGVGTVTVQPGSACWVN